MGDIAEPGALEKGKQDECSCEHICFFPIVGSFIRFSRSISLAIGYSYILGAESCAPEVCNHCVQGGTFVVVVEQYVFNFHI